MLKAISLVIRFCLVTIFLLGTLSLQSQSSELVNAIGMRFVEIQPGKMIVGKYQPTVSRGWGYDEKRKSEFPQILPESDFQLAYQLAAEAALPGFEVVIDQPYYIGKFEVSQGEWKKIMTTNPSYFQGDKVDGSADQYPVESVSFKDVQSFIRQLNKFDKEYIYRLPTEFEWEYAARAGAQDDISWSEINSVAVIASKTPKAVGSKMPNAWGLYDMLGNVWEWVEDFYNEQLFTDPVPPKKGKQHVLKGAPFYGDVKNATYMTHAGGPGSKYDVGFRLVMVKKKLK